MADNLFDPKRMAKQPPPPPSSTPSSDKAASSKATPLTVSQLTTRIASHLKNAFPASIAVTGEVSNPRCQNHWYFDLKDENSSISCVMFASSARKLTFDLEQGQSIVAKGRLEFFPRFGKTQLYVTSIQPVGTGALELAFRKLAQELRAAGYFDPAHKQQLPFFPRRVAVITSKTGAALQDVINTATQRCPATQLSLIDVRVQGDRAAPQIARAISAAGARAADLGIDAIILTRGGGSLEDLWAFNERTVADAIYNAHIPIIAAIGHETDTTIAELVADLRCATPTQAAMRLIPDRAALLDQLDSLTAQLTSATGRTLTAHTTALTSVARHARLSARSHTAVLADRLSTLDRRLHQHHPAAELTRRHTQLTRAATRLAATPQSLLRTRDVSPHATALHAAARERLRLASDRLAAASRALNLVSPTAVLARGYSITTNAQGRAITDSADAPPSSTITTRLAKGSLTSTVQPDSSSPNTPTPASKPSKRPPSKTDSPSRQPPSDQMDLFS